MPLDASILRKRQLEEMDELQQYADNPMESLQYNFVYVQQEKLVLERKILFDNVSVLIPSDFRTMKNSMKRLKYLGVMPSIVYTNEDMDINICSYRECVQVSPDTIMDYIQQVTHVYYEIKLKAIVWDIKIIDLSFCKVYYFEALTSAVDTNVYNISFYFVLDDKVYHGFINFTMEHMYCWRNIAIAILKHMTLETTLE